MVKLPEFAHPPLVEMALGVQFRPLFGLRGITLAPLRERWREAYSRVEEQPPLVPSLETAAAAPGTVSLQLSLGPGPAVRYWFLNDDGSELVQLQQDRLIVNWRRVSDDSPAYPRFGAMRSLFETRFAELSEYVSSERLGTIDPTQAEVNYINAIRLPGVRLHELLRSCSGFDAHHLGEPEQAQVRLTFPMPDVGREPVRLYVAVDPVTRWDGVPLVLLNLTVRGGPVDATLEATLEFMDRAHEHVVRSFEELTVESLHSQWGRQP